MKKQHLSTPNGCRKNCPACASEHTPTPWHCGDGSAEDANNIYDPESGELLAEVHLDGDAAFIVRAVNSHNALVEIAELYVDVIEGEYNDLEEMARVKKIISQAKEGK